MSLNDALAIVLLAKTRGTLQLPTTKLPNGKDVGPHIVVANAAASGKLRRCRSLVDILKAAAEGDKKLVSGEVSHAKFFRYLTALMKSKPPLPK